MSRFPPYEDWAEFVGAIAQGDVEEVRRAMAADSPWLGYRRGEAFRTALRAARNNEKLVADLIGFGADCSAAIRAGGPLAPMMEKALRRAGPSWRVDAYDQGIVELRIVRESSWCMSFLPNDAQVPIRYGGGGEGEWPTEPAAALEALMRDLEDERLEPIAARAKWFAPWLEKLAAGQDFPLGELLRRLQKYAVRRV